MVEFDWGLDALLAQEQFVPFLEDTRCVGGPGVLTRVLWPKREYSHK
jgi:hypothetical protein